MHITERFAAVQHAQQPGLQFQRQIAHLDEEERAVMTIFTGALRLALAPVKAPSRGE